VPKQFGAGISHQIDLRSVPPSTTLTKSVLDLPEKMQ
jgi:hypothetical protein